MHDNFNFNVLQKQFHMRNVRQKNTTERGVRERDRREERGGMERFILSTEKQVESWIWQIQADTDTAQTYSIMK